MSQTGFVSIVNLNESGWFSLLVAVALVAPVLRELLLGKGLGHCWSKAEGSRDNSLGLGTPQGSCAGPWGRAQAGCSNTPSVKHVGAHAQVLLCPHTKLPWAFATTCITQVLLLLNMLTVYPSDLVSSWRSKCLWEWTLSLQSSRLALPG